MPVFIRSRFSTRHLRHRAGRRVETGGILVGHLCVDGSIPNRRARDGTDSARYAAAKWQTDLHCGDLARCSGLACGGAMKSWWGVHSHPAFAWCEKSHNVVRAQSAAARHAEFLQRGHVFLHETVYRRPTTSRWSNQHNNTATASARPVRLRQGTVRSADSIFQPDGRGSR